MTEAKLDGGNCGRLRGTQPNDGGDLAWWADCEINKALIAYMAALDDPEAKAVALADFDSALVRLREVYRANGWQWAADDMPAWGPLAIVNTSRAA
jgi:hypothetical protein